MPTELVLSKLWNYFATGSYPSTSTWTPLTYAEIQSDQRICFTTTITFVWILSRNNFQKLRFAGDVSHNNSFTTRWHVTSTTSKVAELVRIKILKLLTSNCNTSACLHRRKILRLRNEFSYSEHKKTQCIKINKEWEIGILTDRYVLVIKCLIGQLLNNRWGQECGPRSEVKVSFVLLMAGQHNGCDG